MRVLPRGNLAEWIVSPQNPLTARVFANRLWKLFFGTGLAKNLDDFGVQGENPVHPELLDWLASEFKDKGERMKDESTAGPGRLHPSSFILHPFDIKHIVRLIVTSRAYRQSSVATAEMAARDPYN